MGTWQACSVSPNTQLTDLFNFSRQIMRRAVGGNLFHWLCRHHALHGPSILESSARAQSLVIGDPSGPDSANGVCGARATAIFFIELRRIFEALFEPTSYKKRHGQHRPRYRQKMSDISQAILANSWLANLREGTFLEVQRPTSHLLEGLETNIQFILSARLFEHSRPGLVSWNRQDPGSEPPLANSQTFRGWNRLPVHLFR
ncbi:hypothetical protein R3P38DRAFT_2848257 [Favolaschia claudopus]|uniref:Uncharacterized protein n=1 Tax=Favolaschia claudopus TaxID=2862362 RepID=A0AAW0DWA6_9AGAR